MLKFYAWTIARKPREDGNPILRSSVGNFIFFSDFNCLHVATVSLILLRLQPRRQIVILNLCFKQKKITRSERTSKVVEQGNESILKMCIHAKFNTFCSGTICQGTQQISISPLRTFTLHNTCSGRKKVLSLVKWYAIQIHHHF